MLPKFLEEKTKYNYVIFPEHGIGYLPVNPELPSPEEIYDKSYFQKYIDYGDGGISGKLNDCRMELVKKYMPDGGDIVDVGIGSGLFCTTMNCKGSDVNLVAIEWLKEHNKYYDVDDIFSPAVDAITLFDVIEHVDNPIMILSKAKKYVFLSTPIYDNVEYANQSKHYRPNEHLWYYEHKGIIKFMQSYGFELVYHDTRESDLGRESIGSYVFERTNIKHQVYRTTNLINGKMYIGVHSSNEIDDNYIGSGVIFSRAVKKYGRNNFHKETLCLFGSRTDTLSVEKSIVNDDIINSGKFYNIAYGGCNSLANLEKDVLTKIQNKGRKVFHQKMIDDIEYRNKVNDKKKKSREKNKILFMLRTTAAQKDRKFVTNGINNRRIKSYDVQDFLIKNSDWKLGRTGSSRGNK